MREVMDGKLRGDRSKIPHGIDRKSSYDDSRPHVRGGDVRAMELDTRRSVAQHAASHNTRTFVAPRSPVSPMTAALSTAEQQLRFPWTSPPSPGDAIEVARGILWLRMPLPFALDHINLWLMLDGDGWTQLDCGYG